MTALLGIVGAGLVFLCATMICVGYIADDVRLIRKAIEANQREKP